MHKHAAFRSFVYMFDLITWGCLFISRELERLQGRDTMGKESLPLRLPKMFAITVNKQKPPNDTTTVLI